MRNWEIHFDLATIEKERDELIIKINEDSFWDDQKKALEIMDRKNEIESTINSYSSLNNKLKDLLETYEMLKDADDVEIREIVSFEIFDVEKELSDFEILTLLSNKFDSSNAIIEIHPGAGGTESQDWANMLYRMYSRYIEKHKMKMQVVDYQVADDAGIKSASFIVSGKNAYGLLKAEKGVHRLVRISPFDSNKRRHTSFASVEVIPQMNSSIDIEILDKDIRIDTYRSTGAGGQNVNKTDSAVRITHFPTGIVVTCQNERSQIQNREIAMNILKSRLYQIKVQEQQKELNKIVGEQKNIEWGSQIRSYVFCPYTMVKDHRTGCETSAVFNVLDGDIDEFIYSYLRWEMKNNG